MNDYQLDGLMKSLILTYPKGTAVRCIETVVLEDGAETVAFTKGRTYIINGHSQSPYDRANMSHSQCRLTNDFGDEWHYMGMRDMNKYFETVDQPAIAAELEAPAADAVPVVAWVDPRTLHAIQLRGEEGATDAIMNGCFGRCTEPRVRQRDHLATVSALQARIDELESRQVPEGWVAVLSQMTPEQMRAVQMKSEIGSHIASNWSGAYSCFQEFWSVALAAIKPGKKPADPQPGISKEQP